MLWRRIKVNLTDFAGELKLQNTFLLPFQLLNQTFYVPGGGKVQKAWID